MAGASIMDKLQQVIDAAFGQRDVVREPPPASEFFLQQQRRLAQQAEKIAALKKARLAARLAKQ